MLKGFKDFLMRGNVIDLAVAVVIGAAFSAIVKAFTDSIIQPLINSLGNLSGFVGPYLLGLITEATGTAQHGVALLSLSLAAAGVLALRARQQPTLVALSDSSELRAPTRSGGRSRPAEARRGPGLRRRRR